MWDDLRKFAREKTKQWMQLKAGDEPSYLMIINLNETYSQKALDRALKSIAPEGTKLEDLEYRQLQMLDIYLKNRDDWLRLRR